MIVSITRPSCGIRPLPERRTRPRSRGKKSEVGEHDAWGFADKPERLWGARSTRLPAIRLHAFARRPSRSWREVRPPAYGPGATAPLQVKPAPAVQA